MGNLNLQQFKNFVQNYQQKFGGGNPQQMVQQLLNDGQMTQAQFEQLRAQANRIMGTNF